VEVRTTLLDMREQWRAAISQWVNKEIQRTLQIELMVSKRPSIIERQWVL